MNCTPFVRQYGIQLTNGVILCKKGTDQEIQWPEDATSILHSDPGWQYKHTHYQKRLADRGIPKSMSRKGNCLDNAVMENFFGLLKSELLYLQEFDSVQHFRDELVAYLDYYNNRMIKVTLKGLPPALHRRQALLIAESMFV